jgi:HlyD family secretion protein
MTAPLPRRRPQLPVLALVAVLAGGGYFGWRALAARTAEPTAPPTYLPVVESVYRQTVPAPGLLQAAAKHDLHVATAGTIAYVASVGTRVAAGDVVARLDTTPLERADREAVLSLDRARRTLDAVRADATEADRVQLAAIEQAQRRVVESEADEAAARAALELAERLAALGAETPVGVQRARDTLEAARLTAQEARTALGEARTTLESRRERAATDLANARDAVEQAELALLRAREDVQAAELRSRVPGVVEKVTAAVGTSVAANAPVVTVAQDQVVHLVAQVDEADVGLLERGQTAHVQVLAIPGLNLTSEVIAVSPTAAITQNIPVFEVTIALANDDLRLRPGMTAEAEIVVREHEGTVTIPSRGVVRGADLQVAIAELGPEALTAPIPGMRMPGVAATAGAAGGAAAGGTGEGLVVRGPDGNPIDLDGLPDAVREILAGGRGAEEVNPGAARQQPRAPEGAAQSGQAAGGQRAQQDGPVVVEPGGANAGAQEGIVVRGQGGASFGGGRVGPGGSGVAGPAVVRVRLDAETRLVPVEVIVTIGANTVVRGDFPPGAEIEIPAGTTTGTTQVGPGAGGTGGFGFPMVPGGGGAVVFR